jgi:hypothetical protein
LSPYWRYIKETKGSKTDTAETRSSSLSRKLKLVPRLGNQKTEEKEDRYR